MNKLFYLLLLLLLAAHYACQKVLSVADFSNYQTSGYVFGRNFAGASISYPQIYLSAINSTLFQGYFSNSKAFGSTYSMMSLSVKMQEPKGFKYNCSAYASMGVNATCTFNYQTNITRLSAFTKAAGPYTNQNVVIGFDMEAANFSNPNFVSYFSTFLSGMISSVGGSFYVVPIELVDGADTFAANNISNYTAQKFIDDMTVALGLSGTYFHGPGVSQGADASWMDTYNVLKKYYNFVFTLKCVVFNTTNFTASDVLNENNYRNFIINRLTYNGQALNPVGGNIMISEIKLCNGNGIDGVTNGFVSALWAIDFAIEFAMFGGKGIKFLTDITAGNLQSMLGPAPTYTPNPLYYSLLFLSMLSYVSPTIGMPQITAGSSSSIKIYGFTISTQTQVVMINKDVNPNATGVVQLLIQSNDVLKCLYLTASSLSATTNITWAGYTFIGGTSAPQGNFTLFSYSPSANGVYNIPLAYAQAALCYFGNPNQNFPNATKSESYLLGLLLTALLALLL